MNLKTNSILAALALALTNAAQAGPGPHDPTRITPRPIVTREVTVSCPRCQQPVQIVEHRAAQPAQTHIATTAKPPAQKVM